jgi:hypothetical protein
MTDTDPSAPATHMFRLVYRSHSRIAQDERNVVLAQIFNVARANNKAVGVTGALLITDHYFVQALEGEESVVRSLYENISGDQRHENVELVDERSVDSRIFSRWAMAQVSAAGNADIPLHSTEGHIGQAAQQSITRDQFDFLKFMRNTVGADVV